MTLAEVSLDDKYVKESGRIYLTGIQALVRLPMLQRQRDLAAGHDTAGYVSGYRGSPIAGLEGAMLRARRLLAKHNVVFNPGLNEDIAATAIWGSQQAEIRGDGKYDGVFGVWYGKGPGVDRTGDVFRHANHAGSSKHGGVLALLGDDHTCESSTSAHQSEFAMLDAISGADAQFPQYVGEATDLAMQMVIREDPRIAGLALPEDRGLVSPQRREMPVEAVVTDVRCSLSEISNSAIGEETASCSSSGKII